MLKRISCVALCLIVTMGISTQQVSALGTHSNIIITPSVADAIQTATENTSDDLIIDEEATDEAAETPADIPSVPEGPGILVNDIWVADANPTLVDNTTYVSLRSLVNALRPDAVVTWDIDHATVSAEGLNITIYPGKQYIEANGRYLYVPLGVQVIDDTTMLPIRTIAKVFDAHVQWDAETQNTLLTTGSGALVSGDEYYYSDVVYWLSRIIYAESGNQPLEGKIAVGNVILNRVNNPIFPDTVYEVIFQKNQFTPARNGTLNREPNAESVIAAKLCLDGAQVLPTALWFNRAGVRCWASIHKTCIATIGNHAFYA